MVSKIIFLSLFICLNTQSYIPIIDLIGNLSSLSNQTKDESYYQSVIDDLISIMENYAYINILKSPPKVNGSDYFTKVDIIQDFKNLKSKLVEKTPNFYEFYQSILKIIDSAKDYHILFVPSFKEKPFDLLFNLFISSPIELDIQRDKKVLVKTNPIIFSLSNGTVQVKNGEFINENYKNKMYVEKINNQNVFDFIRGFCSEYIQFKSSSMKFVWNKSNLKAMALWQCPLNISEFKYFNITYSNGETISSNYIGFLPSEIGVNRDKNIDNYLYNLKDLYTDRELFFNFNIDNKDKNGIDWDINIDKKIKCKIDHTNGVNVIFQNSFKPNNIDPIGIINNISYCHGNFTNNDYPIIVIESLNSGGFAQLSKLMQQMVQDLLRPKNYFSVIHNNYTKQFLQDNIDSFIFVDDAEQRNLSIDEFYNDAISEKFGDIKIERSKQRLIYDLNFEKSIQKDIFKRNKIKKPTDIIVFTDGASFSATSVFIKNLYYFGGAIMVGYGGDPDSDSFDASQNPTFVLTNLTGIKGYTDLLLKGFAFIQLPIGPMYKASYSKKEKNIPEEFVVNLVDERINIYNDYSDNLYQTFIDEAKKILEKYKTNCNVNNKYMKLLNEECKFDNEYTHGGYQCGNDGKWTKTCSPFYCDEDYYFEYNSQKCLFWNESYKEEFQGNDNFFYAILIIILVLVLIMGSILLILYKKNIICEKKEKDLNEIQLI